MGKLIVIEGTDGSGKATQTALLAEELEKSGFDVKRLEFPRYESESSALVRMYLRGDFGSKPEDVNAYAAGSFFAVDRYASFKDDWGGFYGRGGLVVTDRYTTSNAVHQAPKLPDGERGEYLKWLFGYEYGLLGLPKPDLVIYLDLPTAVTEALMASRREKDGSRGDIHENDEGYLAHCRECALGIAKSEGWRVINCAEGGAIRSIESIHSEIMGIIKEVL